MNEDNSKKQIQINTDFIKIKKKRQTRKKNAEPKLSSQTINTIKNNLVVYMMYFSMFYSIVSVRAF